MGSGAGLGYCGVTTIDQLRCDTEFVQIRAAGLRESHPHDVMITRELQRVWPYARCLCPDLESAGSSSDATVSRAATCRSLLSLEDLQSRLIVSRRL